MTRFGLFSAAAVAALATFGGVAPVKAAVVSAATTTPFSFTVNFECAPGDDCPDSGTQTSTTTLSASAVFTFNGVTMSGSNYLYDFDVMLSNTTDPLDSASRITALGFASDPDATIGGVSDNNSDGIDWDVDEAFIPGFNGEVELCAFATNSCSSASGGASNGVQSGGADSFGFLLTSTSDSLTLSNFAVKFASVAAEGGESFEFGGVEEPPVEPEVIPLPAGLPLLLGGMAAFGIARRMKRKAA